MFGDKLKQILESFKSKKDDDGNNLKNKKIERVITIVIIGVVIMIFANNIFTVEDDLKVNENVNIKESTNNEIKTSFNDEYDLDKKLVNILKQIQGVGDVDVMITYSQSLENVYAEDRKDTNTNTIEKDTNGGERNIIDSDSQTTVVFNDEQGGKTPLVKKRVYPKVQGVIVVANGADNNIIKENIIKAVEVTAGVGSYKVQVFKKEESL